MEESQLPLLRWLDVLSSKLERIASQVRRAFFERVARVLLLAMMLTFPTPRICRRYSRCVFRFFALFLPLTVGDANTFRCAVVCVLVEWVVV